MTDSLPSGANWPPSQGTGGEFLPASSPSPLSFPSDKSFSASPSSAPPTSEQPAAEADPLAPRRRRRRGGRGRRRTLGSPNEAGGEHDLDASPRADSADAPEFAPAHEQSDADADDEFAPRANASAAESESAPQAERTDGPGGTDGPAGSEGPDSTGGLDGEAPRRRRRGRRGGRRRRGAVNGAGEAALGTPSSTLEADAVDALPLLEDPEPVDDDVVAVLAAPIEPAGLQGKAPRRRRRRGRGRGRNRDEQAELDTPSDAALDEPSTTTETDAPVLTPASDSESDADGAPRRRRRRGRGRGRTTDTPAGPVGVETIPGEEDDLPTPEPVARPAPEPRRRSAATRTPTVRTASARPAVEREESRPAPKPGRKNVILVNAVDREETRVAVVEDGQIVDFQMHVKRHETLVNDIYRGKVVNLEPAIGAAFVDFGQGRNGFLHTSDVLSVYGDADWSLDKLLTHKIDPDEWDEKSSQPDVGDELADHPAPHAPAAHHVEHDEHRVVADAGGDGDDEAELVEVHEGENVPHAPVEVVVEHKPAHEEARPPHHGHGHGPKPHGRHRARPRLPISDLLQKGQSVVAQVTKDAIGDKGPTLTTYISIPGRYLVLMPSMARTGVSRKIEDEKERRRLKRILESLDIPAGMGVIVRTAGIGCSKEDLKRDLDYLMLLWDSFGKRLHLGRGPAPLYEESDVAIRTIRDLFNDHTEAVIVDDERVYQRVREFMEKLIPEKLDRVQLHQGPKPLFHAHNVEQDFERIFSRRIDLASGGSIEFDQAEALVAIDVNSGKTRTDGFDFEDVALRTNLDAVAEIARQIRLRDLGGIIVCDFIDMQRNGSRRNVERAMATAMSTDRARSKLGRISQFGLLEMTRQRLGPGLSKMLFHNCPRCRGSGRLRTVESRTGAILRRLGSALTLKGFTKVEVRTQPEVVDYIKRNFSHELHELQVKQEREIELVSVTDQIEDSVLRYLRADGREVRPGGRRKR